jgi:hypothetical protein
MAPSKYVVGSLYSAPFCSYLKRKTREEDVRQTKDLEKQIKDEIREKTISVHRQQQVCVILTLLTPILILDQQRTPRTEQDQVRSVSSY